MHPISYLTDDNYHDLLDEWFDKNYESNNRDAEVYLNYLCNQYKELNPNFIEKLGEKIDEMFKTWEPSIKNGEVEEIEDFAAYTKERFDKLKEGYEKFKVNISKKDENSNNELGSHNKVKLKWTGSKTQLYYLFHKLKYKDNLVTNKYEDLAKFIIENVEGYEEDSLITTKENLEKGKYPKKGENFSGTLIEIKEIE